mmetsp:Transcript_20420/g.41766  ORF Transcript_20420/g.41766 Transcript_20420/m.41766 type:complete len:207 (+) Transcript_20420:136-756(+)
MCTVQGTSLEIAQTASCRDYILALSRSVCAFMTSRSSLRTEVCSSIFASSVAVLNALGPDAPAPLLPSLPRIIETAMGATVPETPAIGSPLFIFQTSALNSSGASSPLIESSWPPESRFPEAVSTLTTWSVLGTSARQQPDDPAGSSTSQSVILSYGTVLDTFPWSWHSSRHPVECLSTTYLMPSRVMARCCARTRSSMLSLSKAK